MMTLVMSFLQSGWFWPVVGVVAVGWVFIIAFACVLMSDGAKADEHTEAVMAKLMHPK